MCCFIFYLFFYLWLEQCMVYSSSVIILIYLCNSLSHFLGSAIWFVGFKCYLWLLLITWKNINKLFNSTVCLTFLFQCYFQLYYFYFVWAYNIIRLFFYPCPQLYFFFFFFILTVFNERCRQDDFIPASSQLLLPYICPFPFLLGEIWLSVRGSFCGPCPVLAWW